MGYLRTSICGASQGCVLLLVSLLLIVELHPDTSECACGMHYTAASPFHKCAIQEGPSHLCERKRWCAAACRVRLPIGGRSKTTLCANWATLAAP